MLLCSSYCVYQMNVAQIEYNNVTELEKSNSFSFFLTSINRHAGMRAMQEDVPCALLIKMKEKLQPKMKKREGCFHHRRD